MGLLSVPLKTVLMYHADLQNETIPESYAVCDGTTLTSGQQDINPGSTYTLPDLRNRFILGADLTKAASNAGSTVSGPTGAPGPKGLGGAHTKQLATAELPSHNHTATINSGGSHNHAGSSADSGGSHAHTASSGSAGSHSHAGSSLANAGAHTHAGSTTNTTGAHAHTITDNGHWHAIGGGGGASAPAGAVGGDPNLGSWNGEHTTVELTGITINANGDHTHSLSIVSDGSHSHVLTIVADGTHSHTITVDAGGAHTHTLSIVSDGSHAHTITIDPTGSGTAWDTRPQYYGLVFIMKVKR